MNLNNFGLIQIKLEENLRKSNPGILPMREPTMGCEVIFLNLMDQLILRTENFFVADFFKESYEDGMGRYNEQMTKMLRKENKDRIEAEEKAQLKELKEKYEK